MQTAAVQSICNIYNRLPLGFTGGLDHQDEVLVRMIPAHPLRSRCSLLQLSNPSKPYWIVMTPNWNDICTD